MMKFIWDKKIRSLLSRLHPYPIHIAVFEVKDIIHYDERQHSINNLGFHCR